VFRSLGVSLAVVLLALVGVASIPALPETETVSAELRLTEGEGAPKLLGENPAGERAALSERASARDGASGAGTMLLSVPKLGLEDIPVPTADSQVALDREGIIHLEGTGTPWEKGSNTFVVGHALGFLQTEVPYVFYELDTLKPGDEILVKDGAGEEYDFRVFDRVTVKPQDFWVTYPVGDRTVISLQTCTPIPTFENRLVIRGELVA
jgi:sortase A